MDEPMFKRIDTVFLPVRNLTRSIDWYVDHLGFSLRFKNEGAATLNVAETPLTLLEHGTSENKTPQDTPFQPVRRACFNIYTHEIEEAHRSLEKNGVKVGPINDRGSGLKEFTFEDPDQNVLSVVTWPESVFKR